MSPILMDGATTDETTRWQTWQRHYMTSSHSTATHVRLAFAVLLTAATVWLGLQILWMPGS